jgi:radical SAM superfamily enzyme YgiQ (UPF0313 family)
MRVLVVNPPAYMKTDFIREGRCMQTKSSWAALWMPLSLSYIAAVLRKNNHEVKRDDCIAEKTGIKQLITAAVKFAPEMIIINTAVPSISGDMDSAGELKKALPDARITIVGMYPSLFEKESLERYPQVDYAVMDEPEWVVEKLANAISHNDSEAGIRGLIFRKEKEIVVNARQIVSGNNPDELPFPARDLLNNDAYILPTTGEKFTLLSIGRGCPESCIFCIANLYYGKHLRKRAVENIADEIEECISKFDIHNFLFWGESFTADPVYGESICDIIIKRNLRITWSTTSRVDTLNQALLDKMKLAGCTLLGLGIESYNQDVLDRAGKRIKTAQIDKAIAMVRKAGISSMGHFIFGLPGDTPQTARKTIRYACKNVDFAQFYCAIPYPKTELGRIAAENGWVESHDYEGLDLAKSVMRNETMSSGEIRKMRDYAYRKFYFRPIMSFRALREIKSLKSFFSALNFIKWIRP